LRIVSRSHSIHHQNIENKKWNYTLPWIYPESSYREYDPSSEYRKQKKQNYTLPCILLHKNNLLIQIWWEIITNMAFVLEKNSQWRQQYCYYNIDESCSSHGSRWNKMMRKRSSIPVAETKNFLECIMAKEMRVGSIIDPEWARGRQMAYGLQLICHHVSIRIATSFCFHWFCRV